jgi:hypothetical protein
VDDKERTMKLHPWSFPALALVFGMAAAQAATLPPERQAGAVSYVTGGVSDDEAALFKQVRGGYPLAIELVRNQAGKHEYTADAQVRVFDRAGRLVLDAKADGPFMLVRVPPGQYRVQATLDGQTVEKAVTVGAVGGTQALIAFQGAR